MTNKSSPFNSKREEIIQTALQLFMQKGYENTTINNIIGAANISKGGMYHYFKSKEEVLDVVIHHLIDIDMERFDPILSNPKMNAIDKLNTISILSEDKPEKLTEITDCFSRNPNSLFDYRAEELSKERTIPIIEKVILQGIQEGIFETAYPEEIAKIYLTLVSSIFDYLPKAISMEDIKKRVDACLHVISLALNIHVTMLEPTKESILGLIRRMEIFKQ